MPLIDQELAGDDGRALAVIDDLQEVAEGFFSDPSGAEVIDDQQADTSQLLKSVDRLPSTWAVCRARDSLGP
jgi:hypothetical protein